MVFIYPT